MKPLVKNYKKIKSSKVIITTFLVTLIIDALPYSLSL